MMPSWQQVWWNLRAAIWRDVRNLKRAVLLLLRAVKSMHTSSDSRSDTLQLDSDCGEIPSQGGETKGSRRNERRRAKKLQRKQALAASLAEPSQSTGGISTPNSVESPRFHNERLSPAASTSSSQTFSELDPDDEKCEITQDSPLRGFQTLAQRTGLEMGKDEVRIVMRSDQLQGKCIVLNFRLALESENDCRFDVKHNLN